MSIKPMLVSFKRFLDRDEGAVTVDFVALMAMICMFGISILIGIGSATTSTADKISGGIGTMTVWNY